MQLNAGRYLLLAVFVIELAGCSVQPAPDVALDMQKEVTAADGVAPDLQRHLAPASVTPAPPGATAHLSPLLAAPAPEGASDVTVLAGRNLGGVWRLYAPHRMNISFPGGFSYGRVAMTLCRMVQRGDDVSGNCLFEQAAPIAGKVDGDRFNLILDGHDFNGRILGWDRLRGDFRLHVLGVGITPPLPAGAERRVGAATTSPDPGTESATRAAIADALAGTLHAGRYTDAGAHQVTAELNGLRPDLEKLGPLDAMSYADTQDVISKGDTLGKMAVFAADFANGSRLCGVELTPDGQINRFTCA